MVVIADTTPLNHLLLIGCQLYLRVLIPAQVLGELRAAKAPPMVRGFAQRLPEPEWIEVHEVRLPADRALARLDAGEAAVIVLAQRLAADLAIIDETQGRREAASRNLAVTGTLTVLLIAAERGLIDFPPTVARLRQSGFRASTKLIERFLVRDRTRRESRGSKGY
jgi:predicted nucleic acid-binding protein